MSRSARLIGSLHTITHVSHKSYVAACCNTALVVQCIVIANAKSASAAAVTRYQASLRSPHNALHSPSIYIYTYMADACGASLRSPQLST